MSSTSPRGVPASPKLGRTSPQLRQQQTQLVSALAVLLNVQPGSLDAQLGRHCRRRSPSPRRWPVGCLRKSPGGVRTFSAPEAQLQATTAEIGVAVADLYPRFTLTGSFVKQSLRLHRSSPTGDRGSGPWVPSLTLPIFDGGRRRAASSFVSSINSRLL